MRGEGDRRQAAEGDGVSALVGQAEDLLGALERTQGQYGHRHGSQHKHGAGGGHDMVGRQHGQALGEAVP
jgi:hypothetical protein